MNLTGNNAALALALLLTTGAIFGILRVEPEVDFVDTVPTSPSVTAYRELIERLDGVRFVAIYMADAPAGGHLRDPATFDALVTEQESLTQFLEQRFPGEFSHQLSAYEAIRAGNFMLEKIATAGNARPESYAMPDNQVRYELVRDRTLSDESINDVLAKDGSSAIMLFFFATEDNIKARHLSGDVGAAIADWTGAEVTTDHAASGLLYSSDYTDDRNGNDLRVWGLVAAGAVAISLMIVLRRPANVALAILGMSGAMLWTFGLIGWLNIKVSFLTLFLAPIVMGVGIDAAIHLLHRRENLGSMSEAVRTTGKPVLIAGATTAAGLAVLGFVPNPLFAQIGWVSSVGILCATLAAFILVAPLRSFSKRSTPIAPARRLSAWANKVVNHPRLALLLVTAILLVGALAATGTRIESGSAENEFPQDDPVIQLQHRIESEYGAFQRGYLIVRGDMTDPAALAALHEYSSRASELPLHLDASSVSALLLADEATDDGAVDIALGSILNPSPAAPSDESRLPQTQDEARDRLNQLFADPLWSTIAPFTITREYDLAVVAITVTPWADQNELTSLANALSSLADEMAAILPNHDVEPAGAPMNRAAIIEQTPINVSIAVFGVATVVVGMLAVAWGKRGSSGAQMVTTAGLVVAISAVVLLGAIVIMDSIYAITGGNNAALNDMFLLAFAITVAVGVDDVVHLAGRFWEATDAGATVDEARSIAFAEAGRAITGTSASTFVAFAVLGGVYFLQSKNLAILTATGVATAYLLTMLLAPLAMRNRQATPRA